MFSWKNYNAIDLEELDFDIQLTASSLASIEQ